MPTISVEEAQTNLPELIHQLAPGEMVTITENDRPVARLVTVSDESVPQPVPGRCRGQLSVVAEDDEHLKDWAEYLP